jgi:hypothetical protein
MAIGAPARAVGSALNDLFRHLGIERANIAAGRFVLTNWYGLATLYPERVASLTLISPLSMDPEMLQELGSRLLVLTGDQGPPAESARQLVTALPEATSHTLHDYMRLLWSDVMADRGAEIGPIMLEFLDRVGQGDAVPAVTLPEQQGEAAGISYHIRGVGPPLVLTPLDLAPSQWEPVIPMLSRHYCTITLGGPMLGPVAILEGRGRSSYLSIVRAAGCGSDSAG